MTKQEFLEIGLEKISQVYLGKNNHCRCGCGGEYIATTFMENPRSPIDDTLVTKRLSRGKQLINKGAQFQIGDTYINIETGQNRALTFYFDEIKNT